MYNLQRHKLTRKKIIHKRNTNCEYMYEKLFNLSNYQGEQIKIMR